MKTEKRTVMGQEVKRVSNWVRSSGVELHTARTLPKNMIERQLKYGFEHVGCSQKDIHQKNNYGKKLKGAWIFVDYDKRGRKFLSLESINYDYIDSYHMTCSSCGSGGSFAIIRSEYGIYKYTSASGDHVWFDFTDTKYVYNEKAVS